METLMMHPLAHIVALVIITTIVTVSDNAMWDRKTLTGAWKLMPLFK
jgi:hypothetical protein